MIKAIIKGKNNQDIWPILVGVANTVSSFQGNHKQMPLTEKDVVQFFILKTIHQAKQLAELDVSFSPVLPMSAFFKVNFFFYQKKISVWGKRGCLVFLN